MDELERLALAAILSGTVVSTILSLLTLRRSTRATEEIKTAFAREMAIFQSNRAWREECVKNLLGPMYMQLDRTNRGFQRWKRQNLYLEAKVIREGNLAVRDLLLTKGYLIPPDLLNDAGAIVEHYDRWLEEFDRIRSAENPDLGTAFTFVGPEGYPFPHQAEEHFRNRFQRMWAELYEAPR